MRPSLSVFAGAILLASPLAAQTLTWSTSPNTLTGTANFAQMHGTALVTGGNLGSSQYLYMIGGNVGAGDSAAIYYAQVTGVGSIGAWQTATFSLPAGATGPDWAYIERGVVSYNGFIYIVGGDTNGSDATRTTLTVLQPTATGDITGIFNTYTDAAAYGRFESTAVVNPATGKLYILGGISPVVNTVSVVQLNNDGTVGTATTTSSLGTAVGWGPAVIFNNELYYFGGVLSTGPTVTTAIVQHATINGDGTLGAFSNTTAPLPAALFDGGAVVYNGNVYTTQGCGALGNAATSSAVLRATFSGKDITAWTADASTPVAARRISSVASSNGIFIVGGRVDASVISNSVYIATPPAAVGEWMNY